MKGGYSKISGAPVPPSEGIMQSQAQRCRGAARRSARCLPSTRPGQDKEKAGEGGLGPVQVARSRKRTQLLGVPFTARLRRPLYQL